jgi:hypothetical protein
MQPVLKVCVLSILPILPGSAGCGMAIMRAEPDAAPADAGPADAALPDAVPIPDAIPAPDAVPCTFDFDLTAVSDEIQGDTVDYQGVRLYSSWVSIYPGLGLGVVGDGPSDRYIDGTEEITISFVSPPGAADISYTVAEATDADGDTVRGMHELRAFYFPSGQDARYIDGEGRFDLDALFPTLDRATRLTIRARQDGIRISRLEYSVCPEPLPLPTTVRTSKVHVP